MGYPTKWGFSVCYFSTDFVRALKVGKNRGTPRSGALGVLKGRSPSSQRRTSFVCEVKNSRRINWDI